MSEKVTTPIIGFKGFDKDLKCRDMQYTLDSTFTTDTVKVCEKGFHFCEYPLDVFNYYPPATSRFAAVDGSGESDRDGEDSKVAVTEIKIKNEVSLHTIIDESIKYTLSKVTDNGAASNSGYSGAASNSGDRGAASNSGYSGAASNSGYNGAAFTVGNFSSAETSKPDTVAVGVGYDCKAKGIIGSWIVLAEKNDQFEILNMISVKVDGITVKENTFYSLKDNKLTEVQ